MIYDTILWYYVWWYLTEYMDWIWQVQNSDSLTAGGSAKIGVKLTREAMEARDLVKTLQKLHWKWPWCFSKNRISSWNWAQFSISLGQPVGYHCWIWWWIYFEISKEVTEMAMIETIVRCLIEICRFDSLYTSASSGRRRHGRSSVRHVLPQGGPLSVWCFFIVVLGNDLN